MTASTAAHDPLKPTLPPKAARRPTTLAAHGSERVDDWFWLRERDNPEVLAYLEAENAYTANVTEPTAVLQSTLFEEIRSHVQEDDVSAPLPWGPWLYFSRTAEGSEYAIHERAARTEPDERNVFLDQNLLAAGHDFFALGDLSVSPDHATVAYTFEFDGAELYSLRFRDIATGKDHDDEIEGVYYSLGWASDSRTIFYTRPDDAMRPFQIWRHALATPAAEDVCVFQEDDERYDIGVSRSRSGAYIFIGAQSRVTSECWYIDAESPIDAPTCIEARREGIEYDVEHQGDRFVVWSNEDEKTNFEIFTTPTSAPGRNSWTSLVAYEPAVRIAHVSAFAGFLLSYERTNGLERLRIIHNDGRIGLIPMPDPVYTTWPSAMREFDTSTIRYEYSSLVRPRTLFEHDVMTGTSVVVKEQPVPNYDRTLYSTVREWATAADGTNVPISLVFRTDTPLDGTAALYLYGYGSYEASMDPTFDAGVLPMLDRGWVYAIGHPRGGGEMGRAWYEDGKMLHKMNTFTDFIACADHLVAAKYCDGKRIVARGGSAGGLLMGAITNLRPDRWLGIVAEVPFVDVVSTMSDASIPLTVNEWEEWGNPSIEVEYRAMMEYSPYDNLDPNAQYPRLLVTGGLNDPRVQYWEPAKYVAKLRAISPATDVLLKMEMGAGHRGPSGRYDAWRDEAFTLAWILTT